VDETGGDHLSPPSRAGRGRAWFSDAQRPARRLSITAHQHERVVSIGIWEQGICRATFRLPLADASRLIGELAGTLSAALDAPPPQPSQPRPDWRAYLRRVRRWASARRSQAPGPPALHLVRDDPTQPSG
jgi:hypothetical protein